MTTEELGNALARARTARGLTLHDAERDTRINRTYLKALEEGNIDLLPAPVYARAFLRTYAQYLGLNAPSLVQRLPGAKPEPELPPLPQLGRETSTPLLSPGWLAAGGVVILLLVVGFVLFWSRGGDDGAGTTTEAPAAEEEVAQGAEQPEPPVDVPPPAPAVEPGVVPEVEGQNALVALQALDEAGLRFVIIEVETDEMEPGDVVQQTPAPGTVADESTVVTLVVSRVSDP